MPAPLPKALRDRFGRLIREGLSGRAASRRLHVSAATGVRWAQQIRSVGAAAVAPMGRPSGTGKLAPHVEFFRELVTQDPDITLFELRDALAEAEGV
ncbi:MAG: IS630 family transposase, partial [Sphingomonadaceae bacterium]